MTWIFRLWLCGFLLWNLYCLVEQNIYRADLLGRVPQLGDLSLSLLSAMNLVGVIAIFLLFNWRRSGVVLVSLVMLVTTIVHFVVAAPMTRVGAWLLLLATFFLLFFFNKDKFAKRKLVNTNSR